MNMKRVFDEIIKSLKKLIEKTNRLSQSDDPVTRKAYEEEVEFIRGEIESTSTIINKVQNLSLIHISLPPVEAESEFEKRLLAGYDERRADYRKINASFGEVPLD